MSALRALEAAFASASSWHLRGDVESALALCLARLEGAPDVAPRDSPPPSRSFADQSVALCFWGMGEEDEEAQGLGCTITAEGVAIVPILGALLYEEIAWWHRYAEVTSIPAITRLLKRLATDQRARSVLLLCDSPGGHAKGMAEAAQAVFALDAIKPVVAYARQACSAGYRFCVGARRLYGAPDADIGSIGTLIRLLDLSQMYAAEGMESVVITNSGAEVYKGTGARGAPLTPAQRADLKRLCDEAQALFDAEVAVGRGFSDEQLSVVATGQLWIGEEAVRRGLSDAILSEKEVLELLGTSSDLPSRAGDPLALPEAPTTPPDNPEPVSAGAAISLRESRRRLLLEEKTMSTATQPDAIAASVVERLKAVFGMNANPSPAPDPTASLSAQVTSLLAQVAALTAERDELKARAESLAAAEKTRQEGEVAAARESAKKMAVAAFGQGSAALASAEAALAQLSDTATIGAMEMAWKAIAEASAAPGSQSTGDDPASNPAKEQLFAQIRAEVAGRYGASRDAQGGK